MSSVMVDELKAVNTKLQLLNEVLLGNLPENVGRQAHYRDSMVTVTKASTIADSAVPKAPGGTGVFDLKGYNLVIVTTDGNLSNVSYRIQYADGTLSPEIEAKELQKFVGQNTQIQLVNDTAEAAKTIRVHRIQVPPLLAGEVDVNLIESSLARRTSIDSTTANLATGASYTGAWIAVSERSNSILIAAQIDMFSRLAIDWSDDGSTLRFSQVIWLGGSNGFTHAVAVRGAYVRMRIKNTGLKVDGTTGNTTASLYAQIWEQTNEATHKTLYYCQILQNATLTSTTTMFTELVPNHYVQIPYLGLNEVVGTVSGTSPTLQLGFTISPDGTLFSQAETLTTSLTASNTRTVTSGGGIDVQSGLYLRMRYVLTGTTPSFAGTYVSTVQVLDP